MSAESSIAFALKIQMEIEEKRKREATLISHHSLLSETDQQQLNQLIQQVDRLIDHHQPSILALLLNTRKATEANKFIYQLESYRKKLINARTTPAYDSLLKLMLVDLQGSPKDAALAKAEVNLQEFANQTIARMTSSGVRDALITKAAQDKDANVDWILRIKQATEDRDEFYRKRLAETLTAGFPILYAMDRHITQYRSDLRSGKPAPQTIINNYIKQMCRLTDINSPKAISECPDRFHQIITDEKFYQAHIDLYIHYPQHRPHILNTLFALYDSWHGLAELMNRLSAQSPALLPTFINDVKNLKAFGDERGKEYNLAYALALLGQDACKNKMKKKDYQPLMQSLLTEAFGYDFKNIKDQIKADKIERSLHKMSRPSVLRNFVERIKLSLKNRFQPKITIIKPSSSFTNIIKELNKFAGAPSTANTPLYPKIEDGSTTPEYPLIPMPSLAPVPEHQHEWQPSLSILDLPNPSNQETPLEPEAKIGLFFPVVPTHAFEEPTECSIEMSLKQRG